MFEMFNSNFIRPSLILLKNSYLPSFKFLSKFSEFFNSFLIYSKSLSIYFDFSSINSL